MDGEGWLDEMRRLYRRTKRDCERATAQVSNEDRFRSLGSDGPSIATLMKHLGGNHRSRWSDFLTTDGEKRDRDRDREFTVEGEDWDAVERHWSEGWRITFEELGALRSADLERTVTIRGEPHSVVQAIQRNATHLAYHAGQIVLLARTFAGESWQTLSIAPGKSEEHNEMMRARYGDWWAAGDEEPTT